MDNQKLRNKRKTACFLEEDIASPPCLVSISSLAQTLNFLDSLQQHQAGFDVAVSLGSASAASTTAEDARRSFAELDDIMEPDRALVASLFPALLSSSSPDKSLSKASQLIQPRSSVIRPPSVVIAPVSPAPVDTQHSHEVVDEGSLAASMVPVVNTPATVPTPPHSHFETSFHLGSPDGKFHGSETTTSSDGNSDSPSCEEHIRDTILVSDDDAYGGYTCSDDSCDSDSVSGTTTAVGADACCLDNDDSTRVKFEFNIYKSNKKVQPPGTTRTYYRCKVVTCPAKYHVDTKSSTKEAPKAKPSNKEALKVNPGTTDGIDANTNTKEGLDSNPSIKGPDVNKPTSKEVLPPIYAHSHNHPPPEKPRLLSEVRKDFKRRINDGSNIGLMHRQAVLDAPMPISSAMVPTPRQLHDIKYRASRAEQPSGDSIFNISHKHPNFVRGVSLRPDVHIVLVSDFGLNLLSEEDAVMFVDGTFRTTECGLILTILMVLRGEIAVPAAFCLSSSRETKTYQDFFEILKNKSKNRMSPKEIHLDFEEALASGFSAVFPYVTICKDFFHFIQANVKKLGQLGLKSITSKVVVDLNTLWYKPTKADFDDYLKTFLDKWDEMAQGYSTYFRSTWMKRFSPSEWASCGRSSDARSGSGAAEGYNRRLTEELPKKPCSLDTIVEFLAKEDKYFEKLVKTPYQWNAKETETHKSQARHMKKRRTLKHYIDRSAHSGRQSKSLNAWDIEEYGNNTNSTPSKSVTCEENDGIIGTGMVSSKRAEASVFEPLSHHPRVPSHPADVSCDSSSGPVSTESRKRKNCSQCKQLSIVNKSCSTHSCAPCCYEIPQYCRPRAAKKRGALRPYVETMTKTTSVHAMEDKMAAAIRDRHSLFICYKAESGQTSFREITPEGFEDSRNGRKVRARCHLKNEPRSFFLHNIQRAEDHDWNVLATSSSPPPSTTSTETAPAADIVSRRVPASVEQFLNQLSLGMYLDKFIQMGFDMLDTFPDLNETVLIEMGVARGHQGKLLRKVKELVPLM